MTRREIGYEPPEIEVPMDYRDIELIRSALRYYYTGTGYTVDPNSDNPGSIRRVHRKDRAGTLAMILDESYPTTIDEDGTGETVRPIEL